MNFYIASSLSNMDQVRHAASRLQDSGWTHTCDWTAFDLPAEGGTDGLRIIGERERDGVIAADVVIVLTPQGRGTHIELGMAIALGKRVYIHHVDDSFFRCDDHTCAFYWLPQVRRLTGKIDAAIDLILRENADNG